MGQKLLLADGHLLTDSVPLRYGWAGLSAKHIMQIAFPREHSDVAFGIKCKEWCHQTVCELWEQTMQGLSALGSQGWRRGAGPNEQWDSKGSPLGRNP